MDKLEEDCTGLQFWDLKTCQQNSFVLFNFLKKCFGDVICLTQSCYFVIRK